ncbi:MAG: NAD(P)H-hydrate dehydratase [Bacteroidales bacterium]|nr:NAD(P)H-hydrate dehydratase [Bacteroidales bacterium]
MVLSVSQIRDCEENTMKTTSIFSIDLMERAATHFINKLEEEFVFFTAEDYVIFCGPGNNGGDGLAIARLLTQKAQNASKENNQLHIRSITVITCFGEAKLSPDCQANLARLKNIESPILEIRPFAPAMQLASCSLLIDSVFGIGLSRPLEGYFADVVDFINKRKSVATRIIAVDVPSGLMTDTHTPPRNKVVNADYTFTFQFQKLAYLLPENQERIGQINIIDIGLILPTNEKGYRPLAKLIDEDIVKKIHRPAKKFDHKGTNGFGLLIAGCNAMPGAALLSAKAAMRSGIGKVAVHAPEKVCDFVINYLPEALLDPDPENCFSQVRLDTLPINAIAVGPGLGKDKKSVVALKNLIDEVQSPMIFDADALNILGDNKTWLDFLPHGSILTPHFKEFERLAGQSENDFDRINKLKALANRHSVIIILKGAHTAIALPDGRLFFNTTGNPGMATAGAGDVLTGILLACLAKGYPPDHAALLAVWLHGKAGDLAISKDQWPESSAPESLIASDIIDNLGRAFPK